MNQSIGIIGTGAVGSALARAFTQAGHTIRALIDSRNQTALALRDKLQLEDCATDLNKLTGALNCLFICVPDNQIEQVDRAVARVVSHLQISLCAHTSGALPGSVLKDISACGISVGSLHPLQTFAIDHKNINLSGVHFAIEGDSGVVETLAKMVQQLGGIPVELPTGSKIFYHAAAVFASNFLPVILRAALELAAAADISPETGRKMLAPLMRQSLENCLKLGEVTALTGPVVRGDLNTIMLHLEALAPLNRYTADLYRQLSLGALELAQEKGLNDDVAQSIYQLLNSNRRYT